jgi:hypothetical protein
VPSRSKPSNLRATKQDEATFAEVVRLIAASREKAFQTVNTELIDLYWQVGATISRKIKTAEWGDGVVERLAAYIANTQPGLRGFTQAGSRRLGGFIERPRVPPTDSLDALLNRRGKDAFSLEAQNRAPTLPHHGDDYLKFPPRSALDS